MTQLTLTHILKRSLIHRRARSLSALIALTVSAAVATALLTLYADLDNKLHKEFRTFGANIVITIPNTTSSSAQSLALDQNSSLPNQTTSDPATNISSRKDTPSGVSINRAPKGAAALPKARLSPPSLPYPEPQPPQEDTAFQNLLAQIQKAAGPEAITAPFAYAVATTATGTPIVVAGTDFAAVRRLDSWWQVTAWPRSKNEALIGQKAAQFTGTTNPITLTYNNQPITLTTTVHLKTGGDEDSRIYIPLEAFTAWTGQTPTVIELQIPGGAATVEAALTRLRAIPGIDPQPVRQLVAGESQIVDRTHSLMFAAVLLIALTVAVSVLATLSASVLERRRDFALMKALGGGQLHLLGIFLLEALALALAGVVAGFVLGSLAALAISEANFRTATLPRLGVIPLVLLLNLVIASLAALLPARVLRTLQPAALLKGE